MGSLGPIIALSPAVNLTQSRKDAEAEEFHRTKEQFSPNGSNRCGAMPGANSLFSAAWRLSAFASTAVSGKTWNFTALHRELAGLGLGWPEEHPGEGFALRR